MGCRDAQLGNGLGLVSSLIFGLCLASASTAQDNTLLLDRGDLTRAGGFGYVAESALPPPPDPEVPVLGPIKDSPATALLRRLAAQGKAAGFAGLLYDNRDRDHSRLSPESFPGLTQLRYSKPLQKSGIDYGLAGQILFPAPVLGNSSMAVTKGEGWRSLPRLAMTTTGGPARAYRLYAANALYVYPEHRDFDTYDMFPANWPYTVISQGSSGSDQPFLEALAMTLAAFPPETRARLTQEQLIAPTLQMILRRSRQPVTSAAAYLSSAAHPPVFDAKTLVPGRMVGMAAALRPDEIPPMVRLDITEESFSDDPADRSRLFDTPSAIARVWRGPETQHDLVLSAGRTFDPNQRPLSFHWVVLSGDSAQIRINLNGPRNDRARIRLTWHDPNAGDRRQGLPSSRIDIGVFAWNGVHYSAPAILSVLLPLHAPPGGAAPQPGIPIDPMLFPAPPDG